MLRAHEGRTPVPTNPRRPQRVAPIRTLPEARRGLPHSKRAEIFSQLRLGRSSRAVASSVQCDRSTVDRLIRNVVKYGEFTSPYRMKLGRDEVLDESDKQALFEELLFHGWMYQEEIKYWLLTKRGKTIDRSNISRLIKREGWSKKKMQLMNIRRDDDLREAYRNSLRRFTAEDLVFLDESLFNEKTGWRHKAYAPIGSSARYSLNLSRGKTWAILPAYTVNGYLPCTGVKEGYYNTELFIDWLRQRLFPALRERYGDRTMVIILDNASVHCDPTVAELIEDEGHVVQYLPPYSPDYNPIELTFSVLKSWIKRNYVYHRYEFERFGDFLETAVRVSRCD